MRRHHLRFIGPVCLALSAVVAGATAGLPARAQTLHNEDSSAFAGQQKPQRVSVTDGFLVPSTHNRSRAAGYFTIHNDDAEDHLLQKIASPLCQSITARHSNQEVTSSTESLFTHLAIPHNSEMIFAPSSYHLLCNDMQSPPEAGAHVPFSFTFMGGKTVTVSFVVKADDRK